MTTKKSLHAAIRIQWREFVILNFYAKASKFDIFGIQKENIRALSDVEAPGLILFFWSDSRYFELSSTVFLVFIFGAVHTILTLVDEDLLAIAFTCQAVFINTL